MGNWKREKKKQRMEVFLADYYKGKNTEVINKYYTDSLLKDML